MAVGLVVAARMPPHRASRASIVAARLPPHRSSWASIVAARMPPHRSSRASSSSGNATTPWHYGR